MRRIVFHVNRDKPGADSVCRRLAELAVSLGLDVGDGPDDAPDAFARTIDGVRAVSAHCRAAGIVPVVENFDDLRSPTCRPGDIARLLAEVPDLAFNFDTGNFAILDESPLDLYPRFSGRIAYLHAKDRSPSPEHGGSPLATQGGATLYGCPVGSGAIPFEALFRRLAADGTDVPVAIECYGVRDMNAAVLGSARFLSPFLRQRREPCAAESSPRPIPTGAPLHA